MYNRLNERTDEKQITKGTIYRNAFILTFAPMVLSMIMTGLMKLLPFSEEERIEFITAHYKLGMMIFGLRLLAYIVAYYILVLKPLGGFGTLAVLIPGYRGHVFILSEVVSCLFYDPDAMYPEDNPDGRDCFVFLVPFLFIGRLFLALAIPPLFVLIHSLFGGKTVLMDED